MGKGAPITITLYDENDEPKTQFQRLIVPWGMLKRAIRLSKDLDVENITEDSLDALSGFVVELFGNKFSIKDLEDGAELGEIIAVIQAVVSKARGVINPT
jgi:hypothetical protein